MRLINATQFLNGGEDFFKEVYDAGGVPYAILSQRWEEDEVSFKELELLSDSSNVRRKKGYLKIKNACRRALDDRLNYLWVDTCEFWRIVVLDILRN